jgi:gluconokinase
MGAAVGQPLVLALDIGTSSVRAALYDCAGAEVEGTQARLTRALCTSLDGGAELDAGQAIEQAAQVIDEALSRFAHLDAEIEAVAVSCFWHSLVGIDGAGRPRTPVLGWADTRAARFAEELRRRFDEGATHARTGCPFHPSYWPAKLLRLRAEEAESYRAVRRWLSFGELLASAFFGETQMSVSMASGTGLLNLRTCEWDEELLAGLGLARELLPEIAGAGKAFVRLKGEYARRWPRLRNARWFPAVADGAASNVGAGCTTRERVALMIGTSGAMRSMWEGEPPEALPGALWCYRVDRRRVLVGGALSDGGGLYGWLADSLALPADASAREDALAQMEPDAHGLTVLPFWAGERSPGWSTEARGAILGLTMHTSPIEILRAAMEAVAYRFALIAAPLDGFAPGAEVIGSGGALLSSPVWAQVLADVLGRPVRLSGVGEASSRGAALLALEATGKLKSIHQAPAPAADAYEPDAARQARYRAGLERQQQLYARLVGDAGLAALLGGGRPGARAADALRCETPAEHPPR